MKHVLLLVKSQHFGSLLTLYIRGSGRVLGKAREEGGFCWLSCLDTQSASIENDIWQTVERAWKTNTPYS